MSELQRFQREVGEWGRATFPHSTPSSITMHLGEEATELAIAARGYDRTQGDGYDVLASSHADDAAEEAADVFLILLHLCHRLDIDLLTAARAKFETCQEREWAVDPERGYARHVEAG